MAKQVIAILLAAFLLLSSSIVYVYAEGPSTYPKDLNCGVVEPGSTCTEYITISSGATNLTGITISASGTGSQWVSFSSTYISKIPAGSEMMVIVYLKLSSDASADNYTCTVNVAASGYSATVRLTFEVPIVVQMNLNDSDISIFSGENKSVQLTIKPLNADINVTLSATADIRDLIVLPVVGRVAKGVSAIKQIEVRVPAEAVEPVGKHSGYITVKYSGGEEDILITIEIFPAKSWFTEIRSNIDALPSLEAVHQAINRTAGDSEQIKEALRNIVNLTEKDPSHFYDITRPFLETSVATYRLLAIDVLNAFNQKDFAQCDIKLASSNAKLSELKKLLDKERRTDYDRLMESIYDQDQLSGIQAGWEITVACGKAEVEETSGNEDYDKGLNEKLLIPSRDFFTSAGSHFDNASEIYGGTCGNNEKAGHCGDRKSECLNQVLQKNQEIEATKQRGNESKDAGESAIEEGQKANFAPIALNHYKNALEYFNLAQNEFSTLGGNEGEALVAEIANRIQELNRAKTHEKIMIALYILPFLIVLALVAHIKLGLTGKRRKIVKDIKKKQEEDEALFRQVRERIEKLAERKYGWLVLDEAAKELAVDSKLLAKFFAKLKARKEGLVYRFPNIEKSFRK